MKGSVSPAISLIDVGASKREHFYERIVIVDGCDLKAIVAIFLFDWFVDGKAIF